MKNFLAFNNLILNENNDISNIIKSSSEVSECLITNVLDDISSSIWISNEEIPQEIIINLSRSFLKEYPKKIKAIGIYCWHAYPTNPKLIEILISKNNDNNYISFGNFDLCLKPGRQLLQLDEENDTNFLITENNNYIIKIIIKETYGDKRTYINNIYLYENIDFISSGKNNINTFDTIKEEDDSSSIFYLRESRERTLPRKKNSKLNNNNNIINNNNIFNNNNDNIEHIIEFQNNLFNALGGDVDLILENLDDLNNLNMPPLHSSSIFQMNEEGIKSNFINIYKISEDFFIVSSIKKIKTNNDVFQIYFYMSLFDFKTLEEITKAEIDMIRFNNNKKFNIDFIQYEDNIKIIINISENGFPVDKIMHNIRLNNGEIIDIN